MFKADDYRLKIQGMRGILKEAEYALDIEHLRPRLAELEKEQESPEVWQDLERSTKIGKEIAGIRNKINAYEKGATALNDAEDVVDLIEETEDESLIPELDEMLSTAERSCRGRRLCGLRLCGRCGRNVNFRRGSRRGRGCGTNFHFHLQKYADGRALNTFDHFFEHIETFLLVGNYGVNLTVRAKTNTFTKLVHCVDVVNPLSIYRF